MSIIISIFLKRQKDNALSFTEEFGDVKSVYGELIDYLVNIKRDFDTKKLPTRQT